MAHAKIYVLVRKLKLTTDGQIFAFLTYFEKLSRRSQSFLPKEIVTGICRPSFCNSTARSSILLKVSHMVKINYIYEVLFSECNTCLRN